MFFLCKPSFLFAPSFTSFSNHSNSTQTSHKIDKILIGVGCGLGSAICWSATIILIRKLNKSSVHYAVSSIYSSFFAIPVTLAASATAILINSSGRTESWKNVLSQEGTSIEWQVTYMLIGAVCGIFQIVLFNQALVYQETPQIAMIQPTDLVFGFVLQYVFLGINPDWRGYLGASLIVAGVFAIIIFNYVKYLAKKKKKKQRESRIN